VSAAQNAAFKNNPRDILCDEKPLYEIMLVDQEHMLLDMVANLVTKQSTTSCHNFMPQ